MAAENDGILNETLEQPEGLDGQDGGADGEIPTPETLLPAPEPEGSGLSAAEDCFTPLPAEDGVSAQDAATGGPPTEGQDGAEPVPAAPVEDPPVEGTEGAEAEEKPKRKRAAPRKKAAPKAEDPPQEDETPVEEQAEQDSVTVMAARRHLFAAVKGGHKEGEMLSCQVLAVGPKRCLVDCNGYDLTLSQRDLTYTAVADLRERYHPGQELPCVLKEYSHKEDKLAISVKEVNPNPFDSADQRQIIYGRILARW